MVGRISPAFLDPFIETAPTDGKMARMENPPPLPDPRGGSRWSLLLKTAAIGVLVLVLQVPLLFIHDTLRERQERRAGAVDDIASIWGGEQTVVGPVLVVPWTQTTRVQRDVLAGDRLVKSDEVTAVQGSAWFLPATLEADGDLASEVRYRGIFRTAVYTTQLKLRGGFRPDTAALGLDRAAFDWSRARVLIGVTDARGLRSAPMWRQGGQEAAFVPAAPRAEWPSLIEVALAPASVDELAVPFSIDLALQGSGRLAIAPVGAENRAALRSAWVDPSFDGACLPVARTVGPEGFTARWETAYFGRGYPQQWSEQVGRAGELRGSLLARSAFGVTLASPVDAYRLVERSLKYALLFLVLVFAVFFLIEVSTGASVHPLQYLMVGAALTLFYLGFLALGEFIALGLAYAAAAAVSTALITGYSAAVLRTGGRTALVGGGIAATYAYLYFILQLQDFALLAGTIALFVLLGLAMWVTRRLDWFALGLRRSEAPAIPASPPPTTSA
jgi:inner membrane protein